MGYLPSEVRRAIMARRRETLDARRQTRVWLATCDLRTTRSHSTTSAVPPAASILAVAAAEKAWACTVRARSTSPSARTLTRPWCLIEPALAQFVGIDHRPGREPVERLEVDDRKGFLVRIAEALELGDPHRHRRLTALEAGPQRVASLEALGAAAGGLPALAAGPASDPDRLLLRPGAGFKSCSWKLVTHLRSSSLFFASAVFPTSVFPFGLPPPSRDCPLRHLDQMADSMDHAPNRGVIGQARRSNASCRGRAFDGLAGLGLLADQRTAQGHLDRCLFPLWSPRPRILGSPNRSEPAAPRCCDRRPADREERSPPAACPATPPPARGAAAR